MGQVRKSFKRFARRADDERPNLKIQKDDEQLLLHIYRYRLIRSSDLYPLFPGRSKQVISRRLKLLFHNEFVDRPAVQNTQNRLTPGTKNYVYALDDLGARLLREALGLDLPTSRWKHRNSKLSSVATEHHLEISRCISRMAAAAAAIPGASLKYADELIAPEFRAKRPAGLSNTLRANVSWPIFGHNEGTAPDAIIGLDYENSRQIFFVEIDRGTETVVPGERRRKSHRFWRDTSFLRKMLIYAAAFKSKAHTEQFGFPVFRVLTITTQPGRVELMQQAYAEHIALGANKVKPGLFLFSDWRSLPPDTNLLTAPYQNASGRPTTLIDAG